MKLSLMRAFLLASGIFLLAAPSLLLAQVQSTPHHSTLESSSVRVNFPLRGSRIIFCYSPQNEGEPNLDIYISYRSKGQTQHAHLETIEPEGQAAEIKSIFTLRERNTSSRQLFIITSWPINHSSIGTSGTYYKVYAYRASTREAGIAEFTRAIDVEDKLGSGLDGIREGVKVSFPYKDYESIRTALRR